MDRVMVYSFMAAQRALFLFVFFQNLPGFEHPTTAPSEITLYRPASQPLHHRINSAHLAEIASYDMRIGTGEPRFPAPLLTGATSAPATPCTHGGV